MKKTSLLPSLLIILCLIFVKFFYDNKFVEKFNDWKNSITKRNSFKNPSFIGPWQIPKGVTKDSFSFNDRVCDPKGEINHFISVKRSIAALPPSWRTKRKLVLGFLRKPSCPQKKILVIINSAPKNLELRNLQREYYAQVYNSNMLGVYFILGRTEVEIEDNEDIIIGDFKDSYETLVLKTKSAYEYFESCENAENFVIHDDDVWCNISRS